MPGENGPEQPNLNGRPIPFNPAQRRDGVTQAVDKAAREGWTPITERPSSPPPPPAKETG